MKKKTRLDEMEALLENSEKDLKILKKILKDLRQIENTHKQLAAYYSSNQWMKDYDKYGAKSEYKILSQDAIFNCLQDQNEEKMKIIKQLINSL